MNFLWDDEDLTLVVPHLYLSNVLTANNKKFLESKNIKHIISISDAENDIPQYPFIKTHYFYFKDTPQYDSTIFYNTAFKIIDEAIQKGENVLVHCEAGISRSPTIVASYLIKKYHISTEQAIQMIQKVRPQVNPRFRHQLKEYEKRLYS